jgi:hypothetical protein
MRFMLLLTKTTFIKACFLLIGFCATTHVLAQSNEIDQITKAQEAIANRDWASGESILIPLTQSQPKNPFVFYGLAQVYENTNRLDLAKQIYHDLTNTLSSEPNKYTIVVRAPYASRFVSLMSLAQAKLNAINTMQTVVPQPVSKIPLPTMITAMATTQQVTSSVDEPKVIRGSRSRSTKH